MGNPNLQQSDQTAPVLTHFSHPHPLKFSNTAVSYCSACKLEASGAVYSCTLCSFSLHKKCYDLPQKIKHEFDQSHVLSLQPKPVYPEGVFKCDACGIQGDGFSYHCSSCGTDLHSICASLPMVLTHNCHQHQLSLTFSAPYAGNAFSCDICKRVGSKTWLYRCNLCEFDVHLTCVVKIPSSRVHQHQMIPQSPQNNLPRSISEPANMYPSNTGVYGTVTRPPHHSASMGHPQNQFVATPYPATAMGPPQNQFVATAYPAAVTPMSTVPYNNISQPANYGPVRPANGLGNQILGSAVNGIASGVAQATAQALIQGLVGGGGGGAGGGGGGGVVSHVDVTGGGSGTTDGSLYVDGGYGGTDVGYDAGGGDASYF